MKVQKETSTGLDNKAYKKSSTELGMIVCKESSNGLGNKISNKNSLESKNYGKESAREQVGKYDRRKTKSLLRMYAKKYEGSRKEQTEESSNKLGSKSTKSSHDLGRMYLNNLASNQTKNYATKLARKKESMQKLARQQAKEYAEKYAKVQ